MEKLEQIKTQLTKLGYRLSVAESLSTGNLQSSIGGITGATSYFEGGITVYSLDQKVNLLNIDEDHAMTVNCVSERVAKEMAIGVCKLFNTQIGISTTGYAEPNKEMKIDQPFAYYCIWNDVTQKTLQSEAINLHKGSRIGNQILVTDVVINQLSRCLGEV